MSAASGASGDDSRQRAEAAFGHLQQAAGEVIAAAHEVLNLLDRMVSRAEFQEVCDAVEGLAALALVALAQRRASAFRAGTGMGGSGGADWDEAGGWGSGGWGSGDWGSEGWGSDEADGSGVADWGDVDEAGGRDRDEGHPTASRPPARNGRPRVRPSGVQHISVR